MAAVKKNVVREKAATKKKVAKKKAPGKAVATRSTGTALGKPGSWRDKLKQAAADETAKLASSATNRIGTRNGELKYNNATIPYPFYCVILAYGRHRSYFAADFDSNNPVPPACFSIAASGATADLMEMQPSSNSPDKQADHCDGCKWNEFGTAKRGEGKACKDSYELALISADDLNSIDAAEVMMLSLPPTSLASFNAFHKKLTKGLEVPVYGVIACITKGVHAASGSWTIELAIESEITEDDYDFDVLEGLIELVESHAGDPLEEPDVSNYAAAMKAAGRGARAVKKTTRKKRGGRR